jgi:hypothetical protein
MTREVILKLLDDKKWENASVLAARLTKVLVPGVVAVAEFFRTAEVRLVQIGISATKDEIKKILAQEERCQEEDMQLGKIRTSRTGLGPVWVQFPLGVVRKLAQVGKVTIG